MVVPKKLGAPTAFAYPDGARCKYSDLRCANTVEAGCRSEKISTGTQDGCTLPGFHGVLDGRRTRMQAIILRHFEGGDSVAFQELRLQRLTLRWTVCQHRGQLFILLRRDGNLATGAGTIKDFLRPLHDVLSVNLMASEEELKAEIERLRVENEALKKPARGQMSLKVSEKGALSVYGLGRFPVTLYREQWEKLLGMADEIRKFIQENDNALKKKE